HRLRDAAAELAPVSDIRARLTVPEGEPDAPRLRAEAMADLGRLVGRPIQNPEPWLTLVQLDRTPAAVQSLQDAAAMFPDQWRVRRAAAALLLEAAGAARGGPEPAAAAGYVEAAVRTLAPDDPAGAATGHLRAYAMLLRNAGRL